MKQFQALPINHI